MRRILLLIAVLTAVTVSAKEYQYSFGVAGGTGIGVQFKMLLADHLMFMDELGYMGCYAAAAKGGSAGYMGAINQAVFGYQNHLIDVKGMQLDWYAGGQFKGGYVHKLLATPIDMEIIGGLIGFAAAGGVEANFKNAPFALSFDFRPGYGCLFTKYWGQKNVSVTHVFDWGFNLGLRYTL